MTNIQDRRRSGYSRNADALWIAVGQEILDRLEGVHQQENATRIGLVERTLPFRELPCPNCFSYQPQL